MPFYYLTSKEDKLVIIANEKEKPNSIDGLTVEQCVEKDTEWESACKVYDVSDEEGKILDNAHDKSVAYSHGEWDRLLEKGILVDCVDIVYSHQLLSNPPIDVYMAVFSEPKEQEVAIDRLVGWFRKRVEIKDHDVQYLKFVMTEYNRLNHN